MKKIIFSFILLISTLSLFGCFGNKFNVSISKVESVELSYYLPSSTVSITEKDDIKWFIDNVAKLSFEKKKDEYTSWKWRPTIEVPEDKKVTIKFIYSEEEFEEFIIYSDNYIYKRGTNCYFVASVDSYVVQEIMNRK